LLGVVLGVIADVDVERDALELGPGVDGEMGFRQDHRTCHSATVELVEQVAQYRQARPVNGVVTKTTQLGCVSQVPCGPPATVQIGDNMQSVQFAYIPTLFDDRDASIASPPLPRRSACGQR